MTDTLIFPSTFFYYLRNSLGLSSFKRIDKRVVFLKRKLKAQLVKARAARDPNKKRVYSEEGLESLRRHMREKVNTPRHYRTRNQDFRKDPTYLKMRSDLTREQHQIGSLHPVIHEEKETKRINDYSGVITIEEMESL